ncbi:MAG: hypothetical protein BRC44_08525, partial [Cyanobacteria bacterium QS_4_48_99]
MIDNFLLEKISLAGIARVTDVSEKCLQDYVNAQYAESSRQAQFNSKKRKNNSSMRRSLIIIHGKKLPLYQPEQLIYMDESGIDSNESFPFDWCEPGQ